MALNKDSTYSDHSQLKKLPDIFAYSFSLMNMTIRREIMSVRVSVTSRQLKLSTASVQVEG